MNTDILLQPDLDSNQLYLELSEELCEKTWEQTAPCSLPGLRWQAYLNQLSLRVFLSWLEEEHSVKAQVWPSRASLAYLAEIVNGVALNFNNTKIVIIASDTFEVDELQVPQEWVDIPSWVADYYVAIQVNTDDLYLKVIGYTTHLDLKQKGEYDTATRTYSMVQKDLIQDMVVFWVAHQLCSDAVLRQEVAPLPNLSVNQAENLVERLRNSAVLAPRLEVPFTIWGALIENIHTTRKLYEKRVKNNAIWSVNQWFEKGISQIAQDIGWQKLQWEPNTVFARGESSITTFFLSRQLVIAERLYELRLFSKNTSQDPIWRFELRSTSREMQVPKGMKLRLLTEDLSPFENNEALAITDVDLLFVEVSLNSGECLVWEIEPLPDNYEVEFLIF